MATDVERLIVRLEATQRGFERQLAAASSTADRRARQIETRFQRMNKTINGQFTALGRSMTGALAGIATIRGAKQLLDSATSIDNALRVAGLSGQELERVYARLFDSATRNAAPLETLVTLYGRAALVQKELGVSTEELLGFTNNVSLALRVAGTDAQAASGALLQLSQALGSGVVRAEEFNSILEGAPTIAQAAAAGLKEAGGSVAQLRQLVIDGKVSSEAFFRAFEAGAPMLEEKVSGAVMTIDQRLGNLRTALVNAAREFNQSTEAGQFFGTEIDRVTAFVNSINFDGLISAIRDVIAEFKAGAAQAQFFAQTVLGLENVGAAFTGGAARQSFFGGALTITSQKGVQDRINGAFEGGVEVGSELTADAIRNAYNGSGRTPPTPGFTPGTPPEIKPVSLGDFAAPAARGGGGKKGRGGGSRQNDYQREVEQLRERIALTQSMTAAQAELNPLVDDYGYSLERAATIVELENAAKRAGLEITPQLRQQIEELAGAYATATAEAARLAEAQDNARKRAEELQELGKDVLGGFITDLRNGVSASEALANALDKIASKLLDMALNNLFENAFKGAGGGGGGLLGGFLIPGILHSGGVAGSDGYGHGRAVSPSVFAGAKRYHRGGVAGLQPGEVPAILQKGEVVLPRGAQMSAQPQQVEVTVSGVFVDDNGVVRAQVTQMGAQAAQAGATIAVRQVNQGLPSMLADAQARKM